MTSSTSVSYARRLCQSAVFFGSAKRKLMRKIAPFVAFLGIISTAYVIIKIFFKDSVPYTKNHTLARR
ncbi:MAG: hypothetical protein L6V93_07195 [Clostridiales bacterium]|nr:MAG: hypothetical protein L6V93_07195 [Clostridiales bacterium]